MNAQIDLLQKKAVAAMIIMLVDVIVFAIAIFLWSPIMIWITALIACLLFQEIRVLSWQNEYLMLKRLGDGDLVEETLKIWREQQEAPMTPGEQERWS